MDDGNSYEGYWVDMPISKSSKLGAASATNDRVYGAQPLSARANGMLMRMQDLIFAVTPAAEKLAQRVIREMQGKGIGDDVLAANIFDIVGEYVIGTVEGSKILDSTTEQLSNPKMNKAGEIAWQGKKATDAYSSPTTGEIGKTETIIKQGTPTGTPYTHMTPGSPYTSLATAAQNYHAFTISRYSGPAGFMTFDALGGMSLKDGSSGYQLPNILESAGIKLIPQGDKLSQLASFPLMTSHMLGTILTSNLSALQEMNIAIDAHKQSAVASLRLVQNAYHLLNTLNGVKRRDGHRYFIHSIASQMHEASEAISRGSIPEGGLELYNANMIGATALGRIAGEFINATDAGEMLTGQAFNESIAKANAYLRLALDVSDRNMRPGEMQNRSSGL